MKALTGIFLFALVITQVAFSQSSQAVKQPLAPMQAVADTFTVVIIPDPQYYTNMEKRCRGWHGDNIYVMQTEWIVNNRSKYNVKFVTNMGDLTDNSETAMWEIAVQAQEKLHNAGIAFSVVLGNHDYDGGRSGSATEGIYQRTVTGYKSHFNFTPVWYNGCWPGGIENTYNLFEHGNLKFMVVNLEYAPTKDAICWANSIISENSDRRVIIVTHCYMQENGNRCNCTDEPREPQPPVVGSDAWNLWDELIRRHSNIFMVLSGHVGDVEYRQRSGLAGNVIHEILTDYQSETIKDVSDPIEGAIRQPRCGNGWLRLLKFIPNEDKIDVESITVITEGGDKIEAFKNGTPEFYHEDYDHDPEGIDHKYSVQYEMSSSMVPYSFNTGFKHFNDRTLNPISSGQQHNPVIGMDSQSNFVVVWEDDQDRNSIYNIYMRGFSAGGCEQLAARRVNSVASGQQKSPAITVDSQGNFVVVWEDDQDDNGKYQIYTRGFYANGNGRFSDKGVNSVASGQQKNPAIAMDSQGNFAVAWEDDQDDNGKYQIYARGFYANGNERFHDKVVNSVASGQQLNPVIAMDSLGNFVVVWKDDQDDNGKYQIYARGFYANGNERFHDKVVNSVASGQQKSPAIAMDSQGNFVVVWEDDQDDNGKYQIYARGFYANGNGRFSDKVVNSVASGQQKNPAVAMDSQGNFVVAWEDDQDDNGKYQIYARGFYANGTERFHDMTVNSESAGQQCVPNIALDEDGSFVAVWQDDADANEYYEIVARGVKHYTITPGNSHGGTITGGEAVKPSGSFHSLEAFADEGYKFVRWEGDVEDPHLPKTYVFVDADKTINAHFAKKATVPNGVENSQITRRFALDTNFPNPFNPRTTIHYEIAKTCFVTLKLYTVLGQEVAELVNQKREPGRYDVQFDASMLPSGVYFYKIVAGDFVNTKKMVLLK
jgi:hypothetical protein